MDKSKKKKVLPIVQACRGEHGVLTREFISRVADKWSFLIVMVLSEQPDKRARFSDLKYGIEGISQTMLTSTLRGLERDGIVTREIFPEIPPRVEYELTKFGMSIIEPMHAMTDWVLKNWSHVQKSRLEYDAAAEKKKSAK